MQARRAWRSQNAHDKAVFLQSGQKSDYFNDFHDRTLVPEQYTCSRSCSLRSEFCPRSRPAPGTARQYSSSPECPASQPHRKCCPQGVSLSQKNLNAYSTYNSSSVCNPTISSRVSILQWKHNNGYLTDSDFLSLLTMERECQNCPPGILSKRKRRREEDRLVSHNSFSFPAPVRSDRAGAEAALLGPGRGSQANRTAAPPFHHAPVWSSPIQIPFLTLPTFPCAAESERPGGHSSSGRTPPVICNISFATRGTSAPRAGLACQCTG